MRQFIILCLLFFVIPVVMPANGIQNIKTSPQYTITILSPKPEETFQNSTQELTVLVSTTPELEKEDKVLIYIDGEPVGDPVHSTRIIVPWLPRGSHTVQAKVIQSKGKGAESDVITFYQQRTSRILNPANH